MKRSICSIIAFVFVLGLLGEADARKRKRRRKKKRRATQTQPVEEKPPVEEPPPEKAALEEPEGQSTQEMADEGISEDGTSEEGDSEAMSPDAETQTALGFLPSFGAGDSIAHPGAFGAGLSVGGFGTAVTAKYYGTESTAILASAGLYQFGAGFAFGADLAFEMPTIWDPPWGRLLWGFGAGMSLTLYSSGGVSATWLGISGLGMAVLHFKDFPLEAAVEYRPTFFIGSGAGLYLGGGNAVARYFF